ncbi:Serine/threonine-protein kinase rio1 [Neolecta irregularis DAH-3]|uniref:Serine/threonine-protein kinase RIO1 n=1 Tax=Neolecta irregularis (strain DAH-3) TaxID=1198029 RepID=A0A1U7LUJ2_NEOID|nr:Serine/threonine-protein kinase rio1 [Neolecta irregularis DAH-3]|eukprot:OLL26314.1 Serine/threonine-protein kinase rio1 [Neolecta irregularis DAH-3]
MAIVEGAMQDSWSESEVLYSQEDSEDFLSDALNDADWDQESGDFTKTYNRNRKLLNENTPAFQIPRVNPQDASAHITSKNDSALAKFAGRINIGDSYGKKDRADRATSEQVLDPRTRMILFKMINRGDIFEIHGCISTGKEANVYHAVTELESHRAIKVYKTSILVFKDRDRYVSGEYRFRHGYSRKNPRKMVKVWAEKEMRNLKRLYAAGIPCPEPLVLRLHVLVMGFLGDGKGWAYPRLKDAVVPEQEYTQLYFNLLKYIRQIEYNILYNASKLYIIDVSQSVEHDHPRSFEFLRMDINNVSDYFSKKGVQTISERKIFEFVISAEGGTAVEEIEETLKKIKELPAIYDHEDEEYLRKAYIPQNLEQVIDVERDVEKVKRGEQNQLIYRDLIVERNNSSTSEDDSSEEDQSGEYLESESEDEETKAKRTAEEKAGKKQNKKKVKEDARERRKHKMPKSVKKRKIKNSRKSY